VAQEGEESSDDRCRQAGEDIVGDHAPAVRERLDASDRSRFGDIENPEGQAYEWFVANDREGRDAGPHAALPDLAADHGLPMLDASKKH
jgi:hypothetical protein